eukprot:365135-Chlamydomonas_euryale.AAC.9
MGDRTRSVVGLDGMSPLCPRAPSLRWMAPFLECVGICYLELQMYNPGPSLCDRNPGLAIPVE